MDHSINNLHIDVPLPRVSGGGGGWPLLPDHVDEFAWSQDAFTPDELDAIINIGNAHILGQASTFGGVDLKVRKSNVSFLYPNEHTTWIFRRLTDVINAINSQFFRFDLTSMEQGLQFTRYQAPDEHYSWHVDRGMQSGVRKLSMSLQLSDPDTYKGGDLELMYGDTPRVAERQRGRMTLFPSYVVHRVTPVTEGTRYSLVAWISGPPFK